VNYNLDNALPQGTIYLDGVSILFENSYFANLIEYGAGSITFQDSTVAFQNATFVNNTQSTAGAIFANNTVLSIDNSVFTNNYGFQSGAIQLLGSNSMMYINGTTFLNNTGMHCCLLKHLKLSLPCHAYTRSACGWLMYALYPQAPNHPVCATGSFLLDESRHAA